MSIDTSAANDATGYNPDDDPWATGAAEPPAEDAVADEFDEFADILDELVEEETDEAISVPSSARKYTNPYDVGLKDKQWVPIRILSAEVDPKKVPRLSSSTCVATLNGKRFVLYDAIEAALRAGGTEEEVESLPLPYFVLTANHASDEIQRNYDWDIEVPVFSVKTAIFNKRPGGNTGFKNEYGRSLRLATGATSSGETVTAKDPAPEGQINMHEVAGRMVDTIVLAQLNVVQKKQPRLRAVLDENRQTISVLLDPETGVQVELIKLEDGTGYVKDGSGEVWEGNERNLVALPGTVDRFAISDSGESSGPLQEKYFPINDYLKNTFLPMPERKVKVETLDGEEAEGEITLDTVGVIAQDKKPGYHVDVLLKTGRKVTAVWLGTQWQEVAPDKGEGGGLSGFAGNKNDPVSAL